MSRQRVKKPVRALSRGWRLLGVVFPHGLLLSFTTAASPVIITNDTTVSPLDTSYEQAEIILSGATLTVQGDHAFGIVTITNQGTLSLEGSRLTAEGITLCASTGWLHTAASLKVLSSMSLASNSVIWCEGMNRSNKVGGVWAGVGVTIQASNLVVDATSRMSADGLGYIANGNGSGPGGGGYGGNGGAGGAYGGKGGYGSSWPTESSPYGSALLPLDLGSGGGGYGVNGGGAVCLLVSGVFALDGAVTANGVQPGTYYSRWGGGSGGSILVQTYRLTGSGQLTARGANGCQQSGGGGGGRIAVYYKESTFSGMSNCSVSNGLENFGTAAPNSSDGTPGTCGFFDTSAASHHLHVVDSFRVETGLTQSYATVTFEPGAVLNVQSNAVLHVLGDFLLCDGTALRVEEGGALDLQGRCAFASGGAFSLQGSVDLTVTNLATVLGGEIDLQGGARLRLPETTRLESCEVTMDALSHLETAATLTLESCEVTMDALSDLETAATLTLCRTEMRLLGSHEFGTLNVLSNSVIWCEGMNRSNKVGGVWAGVGVTIQASNLVVDATSRMSADGLGYIANGNGSGPGGGGYGGNGGAGGAYGGKGGYGSSWPTESSPYGSALLPLDLGSGGGGYGVNGGGAVCLLVSGVFALDGTVTANGVQPGTYSSRWGGGAGGSVVVQTRRLAGTGRLAATGAIGCQQSGGGGGGRIAVYSEQTDFVYGTNCTVAGGGGMGHWYSTNGQPGTMYFLTGMPPIVILNQTNRFLVHGMVALDWLACAGLGVAGYVDVFADRDGRATTLAVHQPMESGLLWDATTLSDGPCQVRLVLKDSSGKLLKEKTHVFTVMNQAVAWHGGIITNNEAWAPGTIHIVDQNVVVAPGVTLTIQPGTIVKFDGHVGILLKTGSTLAAQGTAELPIFMTSFRDDSVGGDSNLDGNQSVPVVGDWDGIGMEGSASLLANESTRLRYICVAHAGGTLAGNETWLGAQTHYVTDNVTVPASMVLTIAPGTAVKFAPLKGITVNPGGRLIAAGTVAMPITFTSERDDSVGGDTNGDGSTTTPAAGDWDSVYVSGQGTFDHVVMRYGAGNAVNVAGLVTSSGSSSVVSIANSILRQGLYVGIQNGAGTMLVTNCVITGCDRGFQAGLSGSASATVVNCTLDDNNVGMFFHGGTVNVANTIVAHSVQFGIANCCGSIVSSFRYCDVWSATGQNYASSQWQMPDQTGQNGNISTDPCFKNAAHGDFRLNYRSPCIDSADGTISPLTDGMGAPRYDDPRTTNTGIACIPGAFADMGAFEFVETADSQIDLIAVDVIGPSVVEAGTQTTVCWKVRNLGTGTDPAAWHDRIMLVADNPGPHDVPLTAAEVLSTGTFGPGQDKAFSAEVRVPGGTEGRWRWAIQANCRGEVFEGARWTNNTGYANSPLDLLIPELPTNGTSVTSRFDQIAEPRWFKFKPGGGQEVLVTLDRDGSEGWTKLYLGDGYVPTEQDFLSKDKMWMLPDVVIRASDTADKTYYVMAWPGGLPSGGAGFTIKAEILPFGIQSPSSAAVLSAWGGGTRVLRIDGARFDEGTTFSLRDTYGSMHVPTQAVIIDSSRAELTFEASTLSPGRYDLVANNGEQTIEAHDYLTVQAEQPTQTGNLQGSLPCVFIPPRGLSFQVHHPGNIRWGRTARVSIAYKNYTEWYVFAPFVRITASGVAFRFVDEARFGSGWLSSAVVPITGNGATPGRVLHGEGGSIELEVYAIPGGTTYSVSVYGASEMDQSMDWDAHKAELKPDFISTEAWDPIFNNFKSGIGTTFAAVNESVAYDVEYLSGLGQQVYDLNRLLAFELNRAGLLTIARRYTLGAFGRGRPGFWELTVQAAADGQVTVYYGTIPWRRFDRQPDGTYAGSAGEYASLVLTNGVFRLREKDGVVAQFNSAGALDYTEDPNGKRSTFNYAGGQLTSITDTKGDVTTVQWSPAGRVTNITDAVGREVSFAYDASGEHLESVSSAQGTTRFTYTGGASAASRHAVASIAFPDGTHQYYEYDAQGRITRASRDGGQEATDYGYGSYYSTRGAVYVWPTGGGSTWIYYGADGNVAKIVGPSQERLQLSRDASGNPTSVVGPGGAKVSLNYDGLGNVGQWEDPQGNRFSASYDGLFSQLTSLRDARGNTKSYGYDGVGNLASIRYPGGGAEHYQYDARGNVTNWINGRGQSIGYTYDAKDLLVQKTYPDGQVAVYDYDAHRNLTSVSNQTGVLALQYDAADRVTRVTYPNGRYLRYDYDSGGRRTNMVDQNGFAVQYRYDAQGRLAALRDGSGAMIVSYTYDNAGQLIRRDRANGTHSTYAYDWSGRMTNLVHFRATNQVISRYAYRYDTSGRPTTMTTLEGTWTYAYDQLGQLTRVVTPAGRVIEYAYDAAGNRISVTDNGAKTYYIANQDDQYTQVAGGVFSYDDDGNQIGCTGLGGSQTFGYNAENRMTSSVTGDGTLDFEYDELGNLRRTSRDGVQTDYLLDPFGLGDVVGEYTPSGDPQAMYVHGLGLEAVVRTNGARNYFSHDRMGNTVQLADDAGSVLNSYEYLPFGEKLSSAEGVANWSAFGGEFGVMALGQHITYMRARCYAADIGIFLQRDPIGLAGGDVGLYRYCRNSPITLADPLGLQLDPVEVFYRLRGRPVPRVEVRPMGLWHAARNVREIGEVIEAGMTLITLVKNDPRVNRHNSWDEFSGEVGREIIKSTFTVSLASLAMISGYGYGMTVDMMWRGEIQDAISDLLTIADENLRKAIENALIDMVANGFGQVVGSYDPNDIVGPGGYGDQRWITSQEILPYVIRFENVSNATAAAQFIVVTNQMDSDLDLATFQLDQFGFGTNVFDIPAGLNSYKKRIDMRQENGLYVDFSANLDVNTGLATWRFDSIDPVTGLATEDPIAGFLPPNASPPCGEGFVSYRIQCRTNTTSRAQIVAVAKIVFDANEAIATPTITNAVDAAGPVSSVAALPATSPKNFGVSWAGYDSDSGLKDFTIYAAREDDPHSPWFSSTTNNGAAVAGEPGVKYSFYSVARDNAGNVETAKTTFDTMTHTEFGITLMEKVLGTEFQMAIGWESATGKVYELWGTTNLASAMVPLKTDILATPPENLLTNEIINAGGVFYRIRTK